MKKYLVFFIILISLPSQAASYMYLGLVGGTVAMTETETADTYVHANQFLVGHLGGALGGGLILPLGVLGVGVTGELAWYGNSIDRRHKGHDDKSSYRNEYQRLLGGVVLSLRPGPMELNFEYYPAMVNRVSYSDQLTVNPFRKGDTLKPSALGVVFAFKFFPPMRNFLMFRRFTYNDVQMNGSDVKLPTDVYSAMIVDEVVIGFGSEF